MVKFTDEQILRSFRMPVNSFNRAVWTRASGRPSVDCAPSRSDTDSRIAIAQRLLFGQFQQFFEKTPAQLSL